MSKSIRVRCLECGKKRTKAIVKNPITGKERRSPKNICNECHPKVLANRFFQSSFGRWFQLNALRHCTNSIPENTDELRELYFLWKARQTACGLRSEGESTSYIYDYELCHIDPAKGEDGLVGRLTPSNLIIAPKKLNRSLSNASLPYTRKLSVNKGGEITKENFRTVCLERYDLPLLVSELNLKNRGNLNKNNDFTFGGQKPELVLIRELNRLGYKTNLLLVDDEKGCFSAEQHALDIFETFFYVGGVLAKAQLEKLNKHTIKANEEQLKYCKLTYLERVELRKELDAELESIDF